MAGIAALDYKHRIGKGQHLDIGQLEPLVHFLGPAILDYTLNIHTQDGELKGAGYHEP